MGSRAGDAGDTGVGLSQQGSQCPAWGWPQPIPFTSQKAQGNPSLARPRAGSCSQWGKSTISEAMLQFVNGMKARKEPSRARRSSCAGLGRDWRAEAGRRDPCSSTQHSSAGCISTYCVLCLLGNLN